MGSINETNSLDARIDVASDHKHGAPTSPAGRSASPASTPVTTQSLAPSYYSGSCWLTLMRALRNRCAVYWIAICHGIICMAVLFFTQSRWRFRSCTAAPCWLMTLPRVPGRPRRTAPPRRPSFRYTRDQKAVVFRDRSRRGAAHHLPFTVPPRPPNCTDSPKRCYWRQPLGGRACLHAQVRMCRRDLIA